MSRRNGGVAWVRWFSSDWRGSAFVAGLSMAERGFYRELLDLQVEIGPFRWEPARIARQVRCDAAEAQEWWEAVRGGFEQDEEGRWFNAKVASEVARGAAYSSERQREKGSARARSALRGPKGRFIQPRPAGSPAAHQPPIQPDPQPSQTPTQTQTQTPTQRQRGERERGASAPAASGGSPATTTAAKARKGYREKAEALSNGSEVAEVWSRWVGHLVSFPASKRPPITTLRAQMAKFTAAGPEASDRAVDWLIDHARIAVSAKVMEIASQQREEKDEWLDNYMRNLK